MRLHRLAPLLGCACLALGVSLGSTGADFQDQKPAIDEEQFARIGSDTTERVCTACHGIEDVTGTRRTLSEWSGVVAQMVVRGAAATDAELATIEKYLARYVGAVAVNTAPPEELSAVLGLTAGDAKAIVDYRTAHGTFADAGDLAKVPGIDQSRIAAQPEALRFN